MPHIASTQVDILLLQYLINAVKLVHSALISCVNYMLFQMLLSLKASMQDINKFFKLSNIGIIKKPNTRAVTHPSKGEFLSHQVPGSQGISVS